VTPSSHQHCQSMDEIAKVTPCRRQLPCQCARRRPDSVTRHHAGAEYFKSVPPRTSNVDIDVYDSAVKIDGITGEALVLRAETDTTGKTLTLAENFFVQNTSAPARTEYGGNTFDFYLPKGAIISQSLASAPNGLPHQHPSQDRRRRYRPLLLHLPHPSRRDPLPGRLYPALQRQAPLFDQALRPDGRCRRHAAEIHAVPGRRRHFSPQHRHGRP